MLKNIHKYLAFGILLFVVLGCSSIIEKIEKAKSPQVIKSTDGSYELTVPGNWAKQNGLNTDATLQVANPREELYAIVIQENKGDFPKGTTIDTIAGLSRDGAKEFITNPQLTEPTKLTIGGHEARQFEASGAVSGIQAKYLYAIVETPGSYYQIMTWTLAPRYDANKSKLMDVIKSFKETGQK